MSLVDIGLLPRIELAQGVELQRLLERIVAELRTAQATFTPEQGHQLLTIAFWILAARMLQDHEVTGFKDLKGEWREVLRAVAQHYGGAIPTLAGSTEWQDKIAAATGVAWNFGMSLREIGPEAIGYVYESSLIEKQVRVDLGTHSTPPYLVDYVLGRLQESIHRIPKERRTVVEPACGHGAFLVAALRILAEDIAPGTSRHEYLRSRLRGIEFDHSAKEMARLSLTIADLPNPDGWDLREGDMFKGRALEELAEGGTIFLANAPFEDFSSARRNELAEIIGTMPLANKSAEMLRRALPFLAPDAVVGVIVPRQLLSGAGERQLRKMLLSKFELLEICILPDRVFRHADHECAIILARGSVRGTRPGTRIHYRRVREHGLSEFRRIATVSDEEIVPGALFLDDPDSSFFLPELRRIWSARKWLTLGHIARAEQGLTHAGKDAISSQRFPGAAIGLAGPKDSRECTIFEALPRVYMDVDPEHVLRFRGGKPTGQPQVVLNYHPHSRGPWRLKAHIDWKGAAISSARIALRPHKENVPVELLWAICNSPVANAFVYAYTGKRDISTKLFEKLPIPYLCESLQRDIQRLVQQLFATPNMDLLRRLDALILSAYGFFGPAEQRLCALFDGHARIGLPFKMSALRTRATRAPLYLEVPGLAPYLPATTIETQLAVVSDVDAEIDDGRHELAELRRWPADDERVSARMKFVRAMLSNLEQCAADRWIPAGESHDA